MNKILKSKTGYLLLENFLSLSFLQIIGYILPFITFPYIAKTVGVEKYGEIAFASSVVVFFQVITDYGFNYTAVKDIARSVGNKERVSIILSTVFYAKIILMTLSLCMLLALVFFIPVFRENYKILFLTFSLIPGYIMFPEWFFQGIQKMKYSAIFSSLIKVIFTAFIFLLVKEPSDYIYIPLLNSLGFYIIGFISVCTISYFWGYLFKRVSFWDIYTYIKKSSNMFLVLFFPNFYSSLSVVFLESFWGKSSVGIFDAGSKFLGLSSQVASVISRVFFPYFAKGMKNFKKFEYLNVVVGLLMTVALYVFAPLIIRIFFNEEFYDAIKVLRILSFSSFFIFLVYTYGNNFLVLKDKENILRNIVIGCSILGFVFSLILVEKYSFIGAALTITLIWGLRGILVFMYAKKDK